MKTNHEIAREIAVYYARAERGNTARIDVRPAPSVGTETDAFTVDVRYPFTNTETNEIAATVYTNAAGTTAVRIVAAGRYHGFTRDTTPAEFGIA